MMSMDAQTRSTPKDSCFLGRENEGSLCFRTGDLPLDRGETDSPGSGEGFTSFCGPRGHEARHGIPCAADAPKVIGVFDHQLDWLIPQIVAHVVTSGVFTDEEMDGLPACSGYRTKVPVGDTTNGSGVRL